MTPTAEDLAFALAAVDYGCELYCSWHGLWNVSKEDPHVVLAFGHPTPIAALAAAGRALGLKPKWVVVPVEDVVEATFAVFNCAQAYRIKADEAVCRGPVDWNKCADECMALGRRLKGLIPIDRYSKLRGISVTFEKEALSSTPKEEEQN